MGEGKCLNMVFKGIHPTDMALYSKWHRITNISRIHLEKNMSHTTLQPSLNVFQPGLEKLKNTHCYGKIIHLLELSSTATDTGMIF